MLKVSVIMPAYNSEKFIGDAIQSVIEQSHSNWELLVVDDCSSDKTVEIVSAFTKYDARVKLICLEKNSGAAVARNLAIENASGEFIAFLDSDDIWFPGKLKRQIEFMLEKNCAFVFSAYKKINSSGRVVGEIGVPERVDYYDLLKVCSVGCLTAIYDKEKCGNPRLPLIKKRQDLGLWLEILRNDVIGYGINECLAAYRTHPDSISANKLTAAKYTWKLYRRVEKLNIFRSLYFYSHYSINGVLRKKYPRLARKIGILHYPNK